MYCYLKSINDVIVKEFTPTFIHNLSSYENRKKSRRGRPYPEENLILQHLENNAKIKIRRGEIRLGYIKSVTVLATGIIVVIFFTPLGAL